MFRSLLALASLSFAMVACSGSPEDASSGDEQDIKSSCAPVQTLHCAPGHEVTLEGCASPRFVGAPTYGRCVVSSDKSKLVGTFENDQNDADELPFYAFTFNANGSYKAVGGCRGDGSAPHCFAIIEQEGTWTLAKSGPELGAPAGAEQLVLTPSFGDEARYFYSLDNGKLSLRTLLVGGEESIFTKK